MRPARERVGMACRSGIACRYVACRSCQRQAGENAFGRAQRATQPPRRSSAAHCPSPGTRTRDEVAEEQEAPQLTHGRHQRGRIGAHLVKGRAEAAKADRDHILGVKRSAVGEATVHRAVAHVPSARRGEERRRLHGGERAAARRFPQWVRQVLWRAAVGGAEWGKAQGTLREAIPGSHGRFFRDYSIRTYACVHAREGCVRFYSV